MLKLSLLGIILFLSFNTFADVKDPKVVKIVLSDESPPTSYIEDGKSVGIYREILELLFSKLPQYKPVFHAFPWARAQLEVQSEQMDMFLTFPSEGRKKYASFMKDSLYVWDYGNIVYSSTNPKANKIETAKSFSDLKGLVFLSQEGVDWEKENVPSYIERSFANNIISMVHFLFLRNKGDFFIMSPEQAVYYANKLNYRSHLRMKKVSFIPNSTIHFHLGVRNTFIGLNELLTALEGAAKTPDFIKKKKEIEKKYLSEFAEKNN